MKPLLSFIALLLILSGTTQAQGIYQSRKYRNGVYVDTHVKEQLQKAIPGPFGQVKKVTAAAGEEIAETGGERKSRKENAAPCITDSTKNTSFSLLTFNAFKGIAAVNAKAKKLITSGKQESHSHYSHYYGWTWDEILLYWAFLLVSALIGLGYLAIWPAMNPDVAYLLGMITCLALTIGIVLLCDY